MKEKRYSDNNERQREREEKKRLDRCPLHDPNETIENLVRRIFVFVLAFRKKCRIS